MQANNTPLKYIVIWALTITGLSGCRKDAITINPVTTEISNNSGNSVSLTEDEKLRKITFDIPAQNVKTSVNATTLTMVYTEDISALLDPKGYDLSFSIRLNEDFLAAALSKFSYTLPAPNGLYTTDWAGNDLKVLNEVTKSSVNVNGKAMMKLHLVRYFTFTKQYGTAQEAINQQVVLLNTKTDVLKFKSYVVFGKEYPATTGSAPLVYSK